MAGFSSVKLKRKDLEDVYDDFSDFSLSSPARKIRRLDAELPPIIEEEEAVPLPFGRPEAEEEPRGSVQSFVVIEEIPSLPLNEKALVVYKPVDTPQLQSPTSSALPFRVNADLIRSFKNKAFWSGHQDVKPEVEDEGGEASERCLAVVPWTPSNLSTGHVSAPNLSVVNELLEPMEVDEISDQSFSAGEAAKGTTSDAACSMGVERNDAPQQWLQHCMAAQPPRNTSTPIMWYKW